jgi:hypothetical protein
VNPEILIILRFMDPEITKIGHFMGPETDVSESLKVSVA